MEFSNIKINLTNGKIVVETPEEIAGVVLSISNIIDGGTYESMDGKFIDFRTFEVDDAGYALLVGWVHDRYEEDADRMLEKLEARRAVTITATTTINPRIEVVPLGDQYLAFSEHSRISNTNHRNLVGILLHSPIDGDGYIKNRHSNQVMAFPWEHWAVANDPETAISMLKAKMEAEPLSVIPTMHYANRKIKDACSSNKLQGREVIYCRDDLTIGRGKVTDICMDDVWVEDADYPVAKKMHVKYVLQAMHPFTRKWEWVRVPAAGSFRGLRYEVDDRYTVIHSQNPMQNRIVRRLLREGKIAKWNDKRGLPFRMGWGWKEGTVTSQFIQKSPRTKLPPQQAIIAGDGSRIVILAEDDGMYTYRSVYDREVKRGRISVKKFVPHLLPYLKEIDAIWHQLYENGQVSDKTKDSWEKMVRVIVGRWSLYVDDLAQAVFVNARCGCFGCTDGVRDECTYCADPPAELVALEKEMVISRHCMGSIWKWVFEVIW